MVFHKTIMRTGEKYVMSRNRRKFSTKLLFRSLLSLRESFQKWKCKNCKFLGNSIPEVNISVELSKDKAQALKDYQENGVTYQDSHPWLPTNFIRPSALNLFCTQSSHGIIRPHQGRWDLSATAKELFLGTTESTCLLVHMPPSPQLPDTTRPRYRTS